MAPANGSPRKRDHRILVLAPTGRDGQLASEVLAARGFTATRCADAGELSAQAVAGAGLALIADEALSPDGCRSLLAMLRGQPYWSDLPVIVLARRGEEVG